MKSLKGYLFIISATTFWGISATIAKELFNQRIQTLILVQTRITLSCIILVSYLLIFKRDVLLVSFKELFKFGLLGILGIAGSNFTYYFTINQTNVATAIILQYIAPLLVLLFAVITKEEEVTIFKITACIVSLVGCYLAVAGEELKISGATQIGLVSGLGSAFCWAFSNIWLKRLLRKYSIWTCLSYAFLFASIFWLFINPPWKLIAAGYSSNTWLTFIWFAVISILIPHSLYFTGVRYLTASQAIITATFEPVIAIISAFILLHEILGPIQILGALLVIIAIVLLRTREGELKSTG